jgi:hypothetical protein
MKLSSPGFSHSWLPGGLCLVLRCTAAGGSSWSGNPLSANFPGFRRPGFWILGLAGGFLSAVAVPARSVAQDEAIFISQIDSAGDVTPFFTSATATLNGPSGLTFDTDGNLYVSQYNAGIVTRITTGGVTTNLATGLGFAWGLAIDGEGNLFVAGSGGTGFDSTPIVWKVAADEEAPGGFATPVPFWTGTSSGTRFQSASHVAISDSSLYFSFVDRDFADPEPLQETSIKMLGLDEPGGTPSDFITPIADQSIVPIALGGTNDAFLLAVIQSFNEAEESFTVWSFDSSGSGTPLIDLESTVWGLAVGPDDLVYASRPFENDVVRFDPLNLEAGYSVFATGFQEPDGIAFNGSTLFVANYSAVPEPATMMLVVTGAVALSVRRRGFQKSWRHHAE